jgi:hypothetical protein
LPGLAQKVERADAAHNAAEVRARRSIAEELEHEARADPESDEDAGKHLPAVQYSEMRNYEGIYPIFGRSFAWVDVPALIAANGCEFWSNSKSNLHERRSARVCLKIVLSFDLIFTQGAIFLVACWTAASTSDVLVSVDNVSCAR